MQPTPRTHDPYTDERHIDIDITFRLVDLEAADQATMSCSDVEPFSILPELLADAAQSPSKIMTMEDGLVQTDGTWDIMPDGMQVPFWSKSLSAAAGVFQTPPALIADLSAPASSIGFTLQFDTVARCWPSRLRITAYAGTTQLARKEFDVASALFAADMPVAGYTRVVIEFLATPVPYRRIKAYSFLFGIVQQFTASTIKSSTFIFGASIDCSAIPSRQLNFTFENSDHKYNLLNPTGIYKFLQDGQEISSGMTVNGTRVDMGKYFYSSAAATDGTLTATITANDKIMALERDTYEAGTSGSWTFREAVADILGVDAALNLPTDIAGRTVGRAIPLETTRREALRLVSQAARCSCWIDRDGTYIFRDLAVGSAVDTFTAHNMYGLDCVGVTEFYDKIKLTVRDDFAENAEPAEYTAGTGTSVKSYSNPCAVDGQAVADWLLAANGRRLKYTPKTRGNPALEVGDTVTIYNVYDEAAPAVITEETLTYNGGLSAQTEAVGV